MSEGGSAAELVIVGANEAVEVGARSFMAGESRRFWRDEGVHVRPGFFKRRDDKRTMLKVIKEVPKRIVLPDVVRIAGGDHTGK